MEAIDELTLLSDSMLQAQSVLNDEDVDEQSPSKRSSTFLNCVALGNVGAGKSAVLNSLIGHPVLPTGENGATRSPISIDLVREASLNSKSIILQIDNKSQQVSASALRHSLQDRLSKGAGVNSSGKSRVDEIYLKLRTSTAPPLKLIDLPGLDKRAMDESMVSDYGAHNDAILLVIVPAAQAPDISSSRALRLAKEFDADGSRTIGVISKIDQAAGDQKTLAAVQAILSNQGPPKTSDIPWVALIGQSVAIASAQSGSVGGESSLETAWRAESESLRSILIGSPASKLGRLALVDTLARQIRKRMKVRLPNLLSGLQGKSQIVKDELVRLGEQMVHTSEGTRAIALELCREFEDKFLQHIATGEGGGWKVVASFEGNFPNRMKQLPLDRHFDINNVKRVVLEADGYQPYLISPEKGLRSLIKGVLELAKEPCRLCVDEVHRVLIDIISTSANATPGLGRYAPFKREVITIATSALDTFRNEANKMVIALVDMERAFVPPQHFIRLLQRRMERQRREEEKNRSSKRGSDADHSLSNRASSPQTGLPQSSGSLKSMKDKDKSNQQDKDGKEGSALQTAGPGGEITAGWLSKKSSKTNGWSRRWFVLNEKSGKLGYTKKQEERHFRGVIVLEKVPQLPDDIKWHFIGHLQSNKAKSLLTSVPNLDMVETIDNVKIANFLDRAVAGIGRHPLKVLVQVNTSGEESKSGVEPSGCIDLVKHVKFGCPNLLFSGLMTIGMLDYTSTPENFRTLINCRAEVCKAFDIPEEQCELSMGMSGDFELAIENNSTNVRIGSTIFGPREYPKKK